KRGRGRSSGPTSRVLILVKLILHLWEVCKEAGGNPQVGWRAYLEDPLTGALGTKITPFIEGAYAIISSAPAQIFGSPSLKTVAEQACEVPKIRRWSAAENNRPPAEPV